MFVIYLARKPLVELSVTANVLASRVGALQVEACRIETATATGRWPANMLLQHLPECGTGHGCQPDCPVATLERESLAGGMHPAGNKNLPKHTTDKGYWRDGGWKRIRENPDRHADKGGATRFFKQVGERE